VQDAAAAIPARLSARSRERVIDLCAAPGGKTRSLASAGARVTAIGSHRTAGSPPDRNLARLHFEAHAIVGDAAIWRPPQQAEAVLLDAPCTATAPFAGSRRAAPQDPDTWRASPRARAAPRRAVTW